MIPNVSAFLTMIAHSEGCDRPPAPPDPYRTCFEFKHVIQDFAYHPAELRPDGTQEWMGESLKFLAERLNRPELANEISTAAGRYQITRPTYLRLSKVLNTKGFAPDVQDDMCIQLLKEAGALTLINRGAVAYAITLCHELWASLPGSTSGQPQTPFADLIHTYLEAGGAYV